MTDKETLLKDFMEEHFDIEEMIKIGFFKKNEDYETHAKRVCTFFGFNSVYEYGALEFRGHVSFAPGERPKHVNEDGELKEEPFVTEIKSIYEE